MNKFKMPNPYLTKRGIKLSCLSWRPFPGNSFSFIFLICCIWTSYFDFSALVSLVAICSHDLSCLSPSAIIVFSKVGSTLMAFTFICSIILENCSISLSKDNSFAECLWIKARINASVSVNRSSNLKRGSKNDSMFSILKHLIYFPLEITAFFSSLLKHKNFISFPYGKTFKLCLFLIS